MRKSILLTALLLLAGPAAAAEITPAECSAIRDLAKSLAEANLRNNTAILGAQKAVMSVMIDAYGQDQILDGLKEVTAELTSGKGMDNAALVPGLMALDELCPR
jgi:hypothetical protein